MSILIRPSLICATALLLWSYCRLLSVNFWCKTFGSPVVAFASRRVFVHVLFASVLLESVVIIVVTRLLCVEFMQFFVTSILKTTYELYYYYYTVLVNSSLLFLLRSLERHTIFVISLFAFCMTVDYWMDFMNIDTIKSCWIAETILSGCIQYSAVWPGSDFFEVNLDLQ